MQLTLMLLMMVAGATTDPGSDDPAFSLCANWWKDAAAIDGAAVVRMTEGAALGKRTVEEELKAADLRARENRAGRLPREVPLLDVAVVLRPVVFGERSIGAGARLDPGKAGVTLCAGLDNGEGPGLLLTREGTRVVAPIDGEDDPRLAVLRD